MIDSDQVLLYFLSQSGQYFPLFPATIDSKRSHTDKDDKAICFVDVFRFVFVE